MARSGRRCLGNRFWPLCLRFGPKIMSQEKFVIVDDIEVPAIIMTRNRAKGAFATAVDSLEVGQGFIFDSPRPLKKLYPSVSPKRFGGKHFKLWAVVGQEGRYGVKRLPEKAE